MTAAAFATGRLFVDNDADRDLPVSFLSGRESDSHANRVAVSCGVPQRPKRSRKVPAIYDASADMVRRGVRNEYPRAGVLSDDIQLDAITVDVRRLVVVGVDRIFRNKSEVSVLTDNDLDR